MSASYFVSASSHASGPGAAGELVSRLRDRVQRLINPSWLLFSSGDTAEELIISRQGPVEIRQTLPGWSLETCVKGEPDRARETALRRLGNYATGHNRNEAQLRAVRPLIQSMETPGRWRVRVCLPNVDSAFVATSARNGKVRLRALEAETLAVLRVSGRPTPLAIQHAETAIRHALAPTRWHATGSAMLRLHTLAPVLPFLGRFEVAVPVTHD